VVLSLTTLEGCKAELTRTLSAVVLAFYVCVCVCVCVERIERTIEIEKKLMEIEERGVKLRLTIVDTPGFNDAVDATHWYSYGDYVTFRCVLIVAIWWVDAWAGDGGDLQRRTS